MKSKGSKLSGPSLRSNLVHRFYFWLLYLHTLKEKQRKIFKNKQKQKAKK